MRLCLLRDLLQQPGGQARTLHRHRAAPLLLPWLWGDSPGEENASRLAPDGRRRSLGVGAPEVQRHWLLLLLLQGRDLEEHRLLLLMLLHRQQLQARPVLHQKEAGLLGRSVAIAHHRLRCGDDSDSIVTARCGLHGRS